MQNLINIHRKKGKLNLTVSSTWDHRAAFIFWRDCLWLISSNSSCSSKRDLLGLIQTTFEPSACLVMDSKQPSAQLLFFSKCWCSSPFFLWNPSERFSKAPLPKSSSTFWAMSYWEELQASFQINPIVLILKIFYTICPIESGKRREKQDVHHVQGALLARLKPHQVDFQSA